MTIADATDLTLSLSIFHLFIVCLDMLARRWVVRAQKAGYSRSIMNCISAI